MASADYRPDAEVRTGILLRLLLGLLVVVALAFVLMWKFSGYLYESELAQDPPPPVLPESRLPYEPPSPRLQADPLTDITVYRAAAETRLDSYGWSDEARGIAHIPIERAIDLVVEKGLPPALAMLPPTETETETED